MRKPHEIMPMDRRYFAHGCVTSKPVALPNGHQGLAIHCPGAARDISDCMNEAARICGGPYTVISQESESTAALLCRSAMVAAYSPSHADRLMPAAESSYWIKPPKK
jgi:hypothetical protein